MDLTAITSIGLVLALVAIPQLVIYFVSRESDKYQEPEYEHDYR